MELVVFVLAIMTIVVLSMLFGYDSRDTLLSDEQRLAVLGLSWDPQLSRPVLLPKAVRLHPESWQKPRPRVSIRHSLAVQLYRLAEWIYPGATHSQTA
jgi:hypothetical protein